MQVLMVAPTAFVFNEQTAADNTFMHSADSGALSANAGVRRPEHPDVTVLTQADTVSAAGAC